MRRSNSDLHKLDTSENGRQTRDNIWTSAWNFDDLQKRRGAEKNKKKHGEVL